MDLLFPPGFLWGCATAAHQVEGGLTNNNWAVWEQEPGRIKDGSRAGLACDFYNRFADDFALARALGHNAHRLSIEWSRIEPEPGRWDEREIDHYRRVLEAARESALQPLVTLHHFTNPTWFDERGGWLAPDAADLAARFAEKAARAFGDLVPVWFTINEPLVYAMAGYLAGVHPPGRRDPLATAAVAREMLRAHALMYRAVHAAADNGTRPLVGPVLNIPAIEPRDPNSLEDQMACAMADAAVGEFFLAAIARGDHLLPMGTGEPAPWAKGTADAIGLNYYHRVVVAAADLAAGLMPGPSAGAAEVTLMGWEVFPEGMYRLLVRLGTLGMPVFVTENGISTHDDAQRRRYILRHLREVARAIGAGVDVRGYLHWTFIDNFEWAEGWTQPFGLVAMDPITRERRPRESAQMFREIAIGNRIPGTILADHGLLP